MATEEELKIPEDIEFADEDVFSNDSLFSQINEIINKTFRDLKIRLLDEG